MRAAAVADDVDSIQRQCDMWRKGCKQLLAGLAPNGSVTSRNYEVTWRTRTLYALPTLYALRVMTAQRVRATITMFH
jgi:hypothetical protein